MSASTSAQTTNRNRGGQRGPARRAGLRSHRRSVSCRAATRSGRSGWWCPGPTSRTRSRHQVDASTAACGPGGSAGRSPAGASTTSSRSAGSVRRRFFRTAQGAASRFEVEVLGRPAHSSRSERMSTPMLGLGWKEVAFSGSSRSPPTIRRTRSKSGAGISTATPPVRGRLTQGVVDRVVVLDAVGLASQRREQRGRGGPPPQPVPAGRSRASVAHSRAVGDDQRARSERGHRLGRAAGGEGAEARRRLVQRRRGWSRRGCGGWRRGTAGVSSWSTSMARPAVGGGPRRRLLHAQVGRVPVVAVGDQRAGVGQQAVEVGAGPGSRIAQIRWWSPLRSSNSWSAAPGEHRPEQLADGGRAAVDEQDRRRVHAHLGHPVRQLGGLDGVDPLVRVARPARPAGRRAARGSGRPTRPRTVMPAAVYSWR